MATEHAVKPSRFEHTLLPEAETQVTLLTSPHAVCHLVHDQDKDHRLQLDADENGIVRFHARPSKNAKPIEFALECKDQQGTIARHIVALQPGMPSAPQPFSPSGTLRQPLTGDPLALSNKELIARGYPPRPDSVKHPGRYARWYKRVSKPFTAVTPHKVEHPDVRFSKSPRLIQPPKLDSPTLPLPPPVMRSMFNASWSTWSGASLTNPNLQFFWIEADWNVPAVFNVNDLPYSAVAKWIGLDNSATDLYQAGTDSECWFIPFFGAWTITNYWMWIESLPFAPWGIPNFPVSPGDSVGVDIFVADQNGNTWFQDGENGGLTPADDAVWFMIYNYSQNLSYWGTLATSSYSAGGLTSTGFTGSSVEFIIERPSDLSSGSPFPLAPFGFTVMNNCWYGDALYGDRPFQLGADGTSPFDGNLTYGNMLDNSTGNLLALPFSMPDPNSPGGYQIIWLWLNSL
jgi:hypothetical protein